MITPEILEQIYKNKKDSKIGVFKSFCTDTPDWSVFIDHIDRASNAQNQLMPTPNDYDKSLGAVSVGNLMIKQNFYFYSSADEHLGDASINIDKSFSDAFKSTGGISTVYVNLSSNLSNIPQHFDAHDNFYWQCQGSTVWHCQDSTYTVNPGDLVHIPSKTYHAVDFSMPRAAIGFSWNLDQ